MCVFKELCNGKISIHMKIYYLITIISDFEFFLSPTIPAIKMFKRKLSLIS